VRLPQRSDPRAGPEAAPLRDGSARSARAVGPASTPGTAFLEALQGQFAQRWSAANLVRFEDNPSPHPGIEAALPR